MDAYLLERIKGDTPKTNPDICNGLAVQHMPEAENYIDNVFKAVSRDFPAGLVYKGCERCTPQEAHSFVTKRSNNKRTIDVAVSTIYLMKYYFEYQGEMLPPRYIFLPYVLDGGFIMIGGSRFAVSPVLSDKVISLGTTNIFIRLLRDKLTFERTPHHFVINGQRESVQVVWSLIYHKPQNMAKIKATVKCNCSLVHYLLCKYGFHEMFRIFGNCSPVIGTNEINTTTYPPSEWTICESTRIKPRTNLEFPYEGTQIRVAIPNSQFTPFVKNLIAGFFYVVDHFPTRIAPSYVDNHRLWRILLGHILFSGLIGEGKLDIDVSEHFDSLDEYIDSIVGEKLNDIGYPCSNVYELFAVVIKNFNDWIIKAKDNINTMYDKELSILYFVLMGITSSIFRLHFKLKKTATRQALSGKVLTAKGIMDIMGTMLKPGGIFSVNNQHNGVNSVGYSGDCKYFEITSMVVAQKSSTKQAGNDRQNMNDPARTLHVSVGEVGGYLNVTKSEPSGRSQINPCVRLDSKANIMRDPDLIPLLDPIQELIKRD